MVSEMEIESASVWGGWRLLVYLVSTPKSRTDSIVFTVLTG